MHGTTRRIGLAAGALMAAMLPGRAASAQWRATSYGVAEVDTKQTLLLLAGVSASPGGAGVTPLIGLQAYHLSYDGGSSRTNVIAVKPSVGLSSGYDGGSVNGTVGYAFSNAASGAPVGIVVSDRGEGVVLAGGWDHWGTGGPLGAQALASYNFGSESFWGRARVTTRVHQTGATSTRFGGEVAFLNGSGFHATQPGGVFEWHTASGSIVGLGAGVKLIKGGDTPVYFRLDGLLPLGHR